MRTSRQSALIETADDEIAVLRTDKNHEIKQVDDRDLIESYANLVDRIKKMVYKKDRAGQLTNDVKWRDDFTIKTGLKKTGNRFPGAKKDKH